MSRSSASNALAAASSAARTRSGSAPPSTILNDRSRTRAASTDIGSSVFTAALIGGRFGRLHGPRLWNGFHPTRYDG